MLLCWVLLRDYYAVCFYVCPMLYNILFKRHGWLLSRQRPNSMEMPVRWKGEWSVVVLWPMLSTCAAPL